LATQQSGAVVLAISHHDSELFADPFYAQIIAGVSTAVERTDLVLMLALADSDLGRARLERILRSRRADGVMLMGLHGDDPLYRLAGKVDLPVVYGGRPLNVEPAWYVDADNRGGARLAAEHLIGVGRRRDDPSARRPPGPRRGLRRFGQYGRRRPARTQGRRSFGTWGCGCGRLRRQSYRPLHPPAANHRAQPIKQLGWEMAKMIVSLIDGELPGPLILRTRLVLRESSEPRLA
jgi:DNA-binding LacI/PurR family transcriptional regulator